MLINFKVKNFRSFKEEIEFSMEAGVGVEEHEESHVRKVGEHELLKSAVLFGANASGKSNFVKALESLVILITDPTHDANELLFTNMFLGTTENTSYKIQFIKNSKHYAYLLEVNGNEVVVEKLAIDDEVHFERQKQEFVKVPKKIENNIENLRKNQLLLFFAQAQNDSNSIDAYTWFNQDLVFADAPERQDDMINILRDKLKSTVFKEKFISLLKYADLEIVNIDVLERISPRSMNNECFSMYSTENDVTLGEYMMWSSVIITHTDNSNLMTMWEESKGTRKFVLALLELIFNNSIDTKVIVFDEFNSSFHLELSQALLDLINREKQNNQFILTTHELSLMDHDLRQDQIYLTEKNKNGSTELFSLFDFDDPELERDDVSYKRRYLDGRYRGVPIILPGIMKCILEEEDVETK